MFSKVIVRKGALDRFRKLARQSPLEIHAYLLGEIKSPELVEVTSFIYPKEYAIQTTSCVQWTEEEYSKLKQKAERRGLQIVGDCHSHPNWDAVMSRTDYESSIMYGLHVCGIVSVYGAKTRVRFWTPTSALPCEIIHS